jgi:hypothetical protein
MSTALQEFSQKYLKRPDSWKGLLIMTGFLFLAKVHVDKKVEEYIFGEDGKGGQILLMKSRISEHDSEFREERKKFYWHQRVRKYYIPYGFSFNSKLDYKTLTYNNSHFDTWSDPKEIPHGHDGNNYTFSHVQHEFFHKE